MTDKLVSLVLIPVEVFGNVCEEHEEPIEVPLGLSDAVSSWSDCNRAWGRIYRVEDLPLSRDPGDSVTVYVSEEDVDWFKKKWGDIL